MSEDERITIEIDSAQIARLERAMSSAQRGAFWDGVVLTNGVWLALLLLGFFGD